MKNSDAASLAAQDGQRSSATGRHHSCVPPPVLLLARLASQERICASHPPEASVALLNHTAGKPQCQMFEVIEQALRTAYRTRRRRARCSARSTW
jgi:hypothetical protein